MSAPLGGSQRARAILTAMGEEAFKFFKVTVGYGPNGQKRLQRPLSGRQIAQLKKEHIMAGKEWPYEHISPTALKPLNHPAHWPKGHKHEREQAQRQKVIAANMAQMDKWIKEAKARKSLPNDINPLDRYIMSKKQLYNKYVKARQHK